MTRLTQEMVTARTRVSDMALIKKLNCWGGELKDISLLRRMTNVEVLSLSVNKISTLVDVQYCKNLKELYIRKNEIKNLNEICYLKNLPNLVALWLGENPCSESDPLYRMTVIKNLPTLEKLDDIRIEPEERQDAVKKGKDLVHPEMYENASNNSANNSPRSLRSPPPISSRCLDPEYEEITGNQKSYSPEYEQHYQTSQQSHLYSSAENRYPQANDRYDSRSYQNPRRPNDILCEQSSYDNGVNASHVNLDKNSVQQTPNTSPRCADSCVNNKREYSNEPKNCYTNPEEDEVENRFINDVKLEQLKLYELFVSHAGQQLLVHEPFLRPLLKLLSSCTSEIYPLEVEKHLVFLLNQLCISVMHNIQLLDLFFSAPSNQGPAKFLLFTLLVPFVHREGSIGQQARDALLLCMSLSKKNDLVGAYIAEYSNVCPVLATGLNGLYSLLPRKLEIETEDWHRLTPDDINELPELTHFINSFEFCNAIAQVAHSTVKEQLLEFIYQGFLIPVMGPALLQSTVEELVTATAYYELFIRNATNSGLLQTLIKFLLKDCYDGQRILNTLIVRIHSPTRLCLVTLALLETLINLDSEEVMVELVLKHLVPCSHVMLSQRRRLREIDPYAPSALRFLSLSPFYCSIRSQPVPSHSRVSHNTQSLVYGLRPEESLYGNYHAYLCDAKSKIESCARNCKSWSRVYDGEDANFPNCIVSRKNSAINKTENCDKPEEKETITGRPSATNNSCELSESEDASPIDEIGQGGEADKKDSSNRNSSNSDKYVRSNSQLDSHSATQDIGPFLDALLKSLEKMPFHSLYVNLRLTAIFSRLAVYPQPLLSSLLLNHSLVFQPSIRSLFQVLASVKQKLDGILGRAPDVEKLIVEARNFLLHREDKLANMRKTAVEAPVTRRSSGYNEPFSRGDSRRRSFSSALSSVLRRAIPTSPPTIEKLIEVDGPGSVYRYIRSKKGESNEESEMRDAVLCAVLLDEWLKELAAIAQEHTLFSLTNFT